MAPLELDEETDYILNLGVEFKGGHRIDSLKKLLNENYDAVFIGSGAPRGRELDIPGRKEAAANIHIGIEWLASVSLGLSGKIGPPASGPGAGAPPPRPQGRGSQTPHRDRIGCQALVWPCREDRPPRHRAGRRQYRD